MNINLTSPVNMVSYGLTGCNILAALIELGHRLSLWPIGPIEAHPKHHAALRAALESAKRYDPNAPSVRLWHAFDLAQHVGKGPRVGFPIFELNRFNEVEKHQLRNQDMLLVCSEWARQIVADNDISTPVKVVPLGVDADIFRPSPLPDGPTVFMQIGKWELRKGMLNTLQAFNRAFTPKDDVRLEMVCDNPFLDKNGNWEWGKMFLSSPMGKAGKISVHERIPTQEGLAALMAQAHVGVFPSLAEGWGLPETEMMAMGRPVIMTNYAGHTAFANDASLLIEGTELETAYDGIWFHGQGEWLTFGEPQMEQLVAHMRQLHSQRDRIITMGKKAAEYMGGFSWKRTSEAIVNGVSK